MSRDLKEKVKLLYRAWKYRYRGDGPEIEWMLSVLRPGDVAFDIGAHKGAYTFWMKRAVGASGRVVAFEPQEAGAALLRRLYGEPVLVEQLGLSNKVGAQRFYVQPQANTVSYEASLFNKYEDAIEQVIETDTLDAYCRRTGIRPTLLKIDVEGHELELIQGGIETLKKEGPYIILEVERRHIGWQRMQELFDLLPALGYSGFFFDGQQKTALSNFDPDRHQDLQKLNSDQRMYINNFIFQPTQ
jgi:FkbM family methyltransferase